MAKTRDDDDGDPLEEKWMLEQQSAIQPAALKKMREENGVSRNEGENSVKLHGAAVASTR